MKERIIVYACLVLLLIGLGIVGNAERAEQIVISLPEALVNHIESKGYTSNDEIADEYLEHKAYYDKLCADNYW